MALEKQDYSKNPIMDVPGHILDMVAKEAERYYKDDQDRLLGGYNSQAAKDVVRKLSTHQEVHNPGRRELHRQIILKIVGGRTGMPVGIKPPFLLFAGPPGAGKSVLRAQFEKGEKLGDAHLDEARDIYRKNIKSCISIDFNIFKENLPEYKAANTAYKEKFGDMYAVIRSEASGLNQAIRAFAKEANLGTVQEQLLDVDLRKSGELAQDARIYDMTMLAVTADPEVIRQRAKSRPNPIQDAEVSRAIKGFSSDNAFGYLTEIAAKSFLIDTNGPHKTLLAATTGGKEVYVNAEALKKFKDLKDFQPKPDLTEGKDVARSRL